MKPQHGNTLPDPLRELFIVKHWVQVGVYLAITLPLVPYYYFLAFNTLQLSVWYGVALAISTAPGVSPCRQSVSARTSISSPVMAVARPSVTIRTLRRATSCTSCITAPG